MRQDVGSGLFGHSSFLFIPDITAHPHGAVLAALVTAYACSQLAGTLVATRTMPGGQRRFAVALPLLFIGVAACFPAGLLVYWITSSLWSLAQQLVLWRSRHAAGAAAAAAGAPEVSVAPPAPPGEQEAEAQEASPQPLGGHAAELTAGHVQHLTVHVVRPRRAEEEHRAGGLRR